MITLTKADDIVEMVIARLTKCGIQEQRKENSMPVAREKLAVYIIVPARPIEKSTGLFYFHSLFKNGNDR